MSESETPNDVPTEKYASIWQKACQHIIGHVYETMDYPTHQVTDENLDRTDVCRLCGYQRVYVTGIEDYEGEIRPGIEYLSTEAETNAE